MSLSFGGAKLELSLSCPPLAGGSLTAIEGNKALQKKEMKLFTKPIKHVHLPIVRCNK